ncbi:MAG TPA: glutamate-cysteine ligase family protein [Polyangiaceae bacterium LLY-WYZ-14_1]|nr:glutamate-cysteine ligase family protein [Polyangiaceae bacterium LLY-WYZ-14_1]
MTDAPAAEADPTSPEPRPISGLDDLLAPFYEAETPRTEWRVGTEAEKFGVRVDDGAPLPFLGEGGVRRVLSELAERHGWHEVQEVEGGEVIALRRSGASVTLEPGAQLELSGAPQWCVHQSVAELQGHDAELRDLSKELGIVWLPVGFHPWALQDELPWVPKLRYGVMREYLPTRGRRALDMMRRTCTVQANLDYASEADAFRKLAVSLRAQPIVGAMFANAPFFEGQVTGRVSERIAVWNEVDPDRCGLLPFVWEGDGSYQRYVEWALDVPMFLVKRGGRVLRNTGQTFRTFLADGFQGARATQEDWVTHLNTLFPEARLKKTLELRGADTQETHLLGALPAIWKGLLYDDEALDAAAQLLSRLDPAEAMASRAAIADGGLRAQLGGRELAEWAAELCEIARAGLVRLDCRDRRGQDESVHLAPLIALVARGMTPADALLAEYRDAGEPPLRSWLVARGLRLRH